LNNFSGVKTMANSNGKKSKKKIIIFSVLGGILLVLTALVIFMGGKEEIINVQVEKVLKKSITQTVTATGKVNAEFKVVITPEVTGEIVYLPVKEGDMVKKGDVLLKIKSDKYVAAKDRADANLRSAKADLNRIKAELDRVASEYKRITELHQKRLASDSEIENVKSQYLSTQASYESAQANVNQFEALVKEASEELYKTTITSPMAGTITQLNVEIGERVLGSGFSQGTNILTVSDLSNMEATVDVDENDIALISIGDTARIKVDAFVDKEFNGVVTEIGNSAISTGLGTQEQVTNFEVKIKILDTEKNLKPGMSCNATIETETKANILVVPIQSVTARTDFKPEGEQSEDENDAIKEKKEDRKIQEIVFIINNGKAKTINVSTGISDDNHIELTSTSLKEGDEVVSGSFRAISRELKDGSLVKVEKKKSDKKNK
jgi:HlyD family secretion protein